jgi:hypothetical protein
VGKKEPSYTAGGNINYYNHSGNSVETFQKLKLKLLYDPAVPIPGIYLKEYKSGYNKSTCTPMFISALFTLAKQWKQPRHPIQ